MTVKFGTYALLLIILGSSFVLLDGSGKGSRLTVDHSAYKLAPFEDMVSVSEDEEYNSKYFTMMGDMNVNSYSSDADWLSWEYSDPLKMNMTDIAGYWAFDLDDATDSSGNSNDGTLFGPAGVTGISPTGRALSFDGDDYISVPHDSTLSISQEITLEAWIYPTFDDSGEHMIISKGGSWSDDDPQCYELTIDKDRPLFQMKLPGGEDWYGAAPASPITKNTWHHVAGVYDGFRFYIYIDGVNQTSLYNGWGGSYMGDTYSGGLPTGDYDLSIGRRAPASWGSLFYEGYIDEVMVWDRAIPPEEMLEHAVIPGTRCLNLTGTPDNGDVGDHDVTVNVTDGSGRFDERSFTVTVENVDPTILNENLLTVHQDEEYSSQYSTDEVGGTLTWGLQTIVSWLSIDPVTGLLSGTPTYADVGSHEIRVTLNDGNGGIAATDFDLEVIDVNDAPWITTENIVSISQDQYYFVDYEGSDLDEEDLTWSIISNADWLSFDPQWGILNGTPGNDDVGIYDLNITLTDARGLFESTLFQLEVLNVNDAPVWIDIPENSTIEEGRTFSFDVNATDIDSEDIVTYEILSYPTTDLSVNTTSGEFEWKATREIFTGNEHTLSIGIKATDGVDTISHNFKLELILDPLPVTELIWPYNGSKVGNFTVLEWEGEDNGAITYDVYMNKLVSRVLTLSESSRIAENINETEFTVGDLEEGGTYHWTVIPSDEYSMGICLNQTFSFTVNVPPVTRLESPEDGEVVSAEDIILVWSGSDADMDPLLYQLYVGTDLNEVLNLTESIRHITSSPFTVTGAQPGQVYYWTVICNDGLIFGSCFDGMRSFTVNSPPVFDTIGSTNGFSGTEFVLDLNGTDDQDLVFILLDGPEGMSIVSATGVIKWTPGVGDIGSHTVKVRMSDGIDVVNGTFTIVISEEVVVKDDKDDKNNAAPMIIVSLIILFILIIAVVVFLLFRKKRSEPEDVSDQQGRHMEPEQGRSDIVETGPFVPGEISPAPPEVSAPVEQTMPAQVEAPEQTSIAPLEPPMIQEQAIPAQSEPPVNPEPASSANIEGIPEQTSPVQIEPSVNGDRMTPASIEPPVQTSIPAPDPPAAPELTTPAITEPPVNPDQDPTE